MALTKQAAFSKKVTDLPDVPSPSYTPSSIKSYLQTPADELMATHNMMVDELTASTGAANIGAKDGAGLTTTTQGQLDKLNTDKADKTQISTLQNQVDALVVDGDSSPAVAQALAGSEYTTLKQKLDSTDAQLAEKAEKGQIVASDLKIVNDSDRLGLSNLKEEVIQAMAGTTPVNSIPGDYTVTPIKTSFMDKSKNLFNPSTAMIGYYIVTTTGAIQANATYTASDFIDVTGMESIAISPTLYGYAFYDASQVYISGALGGDVVTVPANAKYIRVSAKHGDIPTSKWQIEEGTERTDYVPYGYTVKEVMLPTAPKQKLIEEYGNDDIPTAGQTTILNATRVDTAKIGYDGLLKSISFRASASGLVTIKLFSDLGSGILKLEKEFTIQATKGFFTYKNGVDFNDITVKRGWMIGASSLVSLNLTYSTEIEGGSYYLASATTVGNSYKFSSMTYRLLIQFEIEVTTLDSVVEKAIYKDDITNIYTLSYFKDALPDGFVNEGWTIGNGATSPVTGGYDKRLYWQSGVNVEDTYFRAKIVLNVLTTNFIISRWGLNLSATGVEFNAVENKLKFLLGGSASVDYSSYPDSAFDITIPFALVAGREYLFEVYWRDNSYQEFSIVDGVTGEKATLVNNRATTLRRLLQHSNLSIIPITGDFVIKKWEYTTKQPIEPVLSIYGDSFIDGDSLNPNPENRYAAKVKSDLGGKVLICGKGGETSAGLLSKFDEEFNKYKPKYTLIAIGTNDSVFATWLSNVQKLIEKIEEKGSIPILATLTKMTALERTAFMTEVNNWILTSGYRYLDANLVTTVNQDRQTQDASLFFGDGIHPNIAGHEAIYKRFKIDLAEVYDYYESTK